LDLELAGAGLGFLEGGARAITLGLRLRNLFRAEARLQLPAHLHRGGQLGLALRQLIVQVEWLETEQYLARDQLLPLDHQHLLHAAAPAQSDADPARLEIAGHHRRAGTELLPNEQADADDREREHDQDATRHAESPRCPIDRATRRLDNSRTIIGIIT